MGFQLRTTVMGGVGFNGMVLDCGLYARLEMARDAGRYNAAMAAVDLASIAKGVRRCVSARRDVQAAYLFGSVASGRARPDSDVDVGVLLARRPRPADALRHRLALMADLGSALHRSDIDVVILNDAPPLLAHRVLSRGVRVFERSASARVRFQVETASRYFDLIPTLELHVRALKKRVRRGRAGG